MKKYILILSLFTAFSSYAQNTNPASQQSVLSKNETDSLIFNYCKVLQETYFNKALALQISDTFKCKLKKGELYNVTQLTDRLSLLIREITKDNHFYIGSSKQVNDTNKQNEVIPAVEVENKNGGFAEVKILDGNIGYIKIKEFMADDYAFQKAIAALQFVEGSKYLIFDLSECPGGDGRMGGFLNCHLFEDSDYQHLLLKRCTGDEVWQQSEVPYNYSNAPKFYNVPVYVIVSNHTASAAEYFALTIKEMGRGIITGNTTAGAGNPTTIITFGDYFAYIPICEIETKDGQSIEGKGVKPNVVLNPNELLNETIKLINK